jgi:hypothetical protein
VIHKLVANPIFIDFIYLKCHNAQNAIKRVYEAWGIPGFIVLEFKCSSYNRITGGFDLFVAYK